MSKYSLIHSPLMLPNQCGGCGTTEIKNGWVDTGLTYEFYGNLYFCENCISEMAGIYGLKKPVILENRISELSQENLALKKKLEEITQGLVELSKV